MPQDEILDGSTWTDVQPKEEILDGSTWVEPVKKKVTTPDLNSGGKTTSQSVSTSTSTSQNNVWQKTTPSKVGDTIGAFNQTKQIPVIAPTNKNVLGKGTVVAPTKEAVKPIDNPYDTSAQYIIQADNTDTGLSNVSQQAESKRVAQEAEQVQKQRELANPNSFENIGAQYKAKALNMSGNNDVEKMIKYGDVNGNMAFLSEMLDDNDKPLFETKSAIDKIDKVNKIYEQQLKSGSITPEQFDAHKKENDKKAIELNTQYVQQMQKRNSSIDDEIKQSEQKLARGYDMKMLGAQPYSVQLTKQEIDSEKKKIKQLTDLKNDVLIDINNPVKSLEKHDGYVQAEKQGLIPTNATNSQKVKIYSYILVDKAKKLATELGYNPNDVKSLIGDELGSNTPKMWWEQLKSLVVGSSDKEREYIHTMAELQAIAPIAILNKNNLTLNEGYTSNLVSSFRKSVAPLFVRNQIATDEDRNTLTKEAFNKAGVNDGVSQAYTDRQATTEKESKTLGKTVARTTGDVVGIGVKIGLINPILDIPAAGIEMAVGKPVLSGLNKALSTSKEVQALEAEALLKAGETATKASEIASIDKAKKVLDIAKVVTEKLPNNFLTRTIYNTTKAGVVHEIQGRVNKELEGFANFEVGAVNHLIGMPLNTLGQVAIRLFGKDAPAFVSQVVHAVQAGTSMTATMAGMTVVNDAKESESFDAFKEKMNEQFGTADKKLRFIAENFLLGLTMHAANISTLSGLFNANYTKLYESLKPEEKAKVDEFVKSVNEDANDFESETKDAVVEVKNDTHENKTTDEEAKNAIEYAGNINFQAKDFGAEAKQDAKIESAVIEIGGKIYEGKNHAEAILKAKADGQDISQVNRQAEGKFKLSDGTIIDRAEAKTRFGQDRSELIIPQDEAAKQANKDYAEITKGLKNEQTNQNTPEQQDNGNSTGMAGSEQNSKAVRTKSEQGKLSNEDKIQQNATTEVQKQITEVEKIISELEDNPNSPFHKLVNLDEQKQKLSELQKKEEVEGVSGSALKDVESTAKALDGKTEGLLPKPSDEMRIEDLKNKKFSTFIYNKESDVPEIFKDKITSKGTTNGKTEIRVTLPKSEADYYLNKDNPQSISEAYHKAKADGTNPELVKAVEDLLGKAPTQYTEAATPKDDSAIQSGGEQKLPDQKEVPIEQKQEVSDDKLSRLPKKKKDSNIETPKSVKAVEEALTPQTENTKTNEQQSANRRQAETEHTAETKRLEAEVEKTNRQKATEKRKIAKEKLDAFRNKLGIISNPKEEANLLFDYHKALVVEAKEYIKEVGGDIHSWAKDIGEKVSYSLKTAWDEATGKIKPIDNADYFEQKVLFNDAIQYYKDKGLSYEEVKSRLDKNEVDYEEADLKDAWDGKEVPPGNFNDISEKELKDADNGEERQIGTKKAINDALYGEMGLKPLELPPRRSGQENLDAGKRMVDSGERNPVDLVDYLLSKKEDPNSAQISPNDEPVMLYYRMQLDAKGKELNNAISELQDKVNSNPQDEKSAMDLETVKQQQLLHYDEVERAINASQIGGNVWSKYGNARQTAVNEQGLLINSINRIKAIYGDDMPAKLSEELKVLQQKYDSLVSDNEKIQAEFIKKAEETHKAEVDKYIIEAYEKGKKDGSAGKAIKTSKVKLEKAKAEIAEGLQDFLQAVGGLNMAAGNVMPSITKALKKIGNGLIKAGEATAENVFDKIVEYIEKNTGKKPDIEDYRSEFDAKKKDANKSAISRSRVKDAITDGAKTVDDVVAHIKQDFPDLSDRQIKEEITGYGTTKESSQEPDDVATRKLIRMAKYDLILEDIENGVRPKRTGYQRDKIKIDERAKLKEIREGLKKLPADDTDLTKKLKTAQDAIIKHLENSIEDLDRQIKTGERPVRNKPIETTPKIEELRKERDRLLKLRHEIDNPAKSDLERLVEKAIDFTNKLNQAKKEGKKQDEEWLKKQKELTDGSISNLVDAVIKLNTNPDEVELARKVKAKENEISKLEEKLNNNDLSKPENKESITSPELDELVKQKSDLVKELARRRSLAEEASRHSDTLQELKDNAEISGNTTISKADVDNGLISDLVQAHIEKGTPISEVQQTIFDELKEIFPDTTEAQVRDAILKQGEFGSGKKTRTDLQNQVSELKKQLNYNKKIEDLQNGIEKETKAKGAQSDEVKALQKQLADAKKESVNKFPNLSSVELERQIKTNQSKIDKGDYFKVPFVKKKWLSDERWIQNNQRLTNLKNKLREHVKDAMESEKSLYMRFLDATNRWGRRVIFFGSNAVYTKLASAAMLGSFAHRIPEQLTGLGYKKLFPRLGNISPESSYNIEAEKKFYEEFLNPKKFIKNTWDIAKTGQTELSKELGHHSNKYHIPIVDLFAADSHIMIKDPVKRATFEATFLNHLKFYSDNNVDYSHPLIMESARQAAYKAAEYEIFQDSGSITKNNAINIGKYFNEIEKNAIIENKSEVPFEKIGGNLKYTIPFLKNFFIPINTVPLNIVRRVFLPFKIPYLLVKAMSESSKIKKGISTLSTEEADLIFRQLKKGTIGAAYWTLGFYIAGQFAGGLYTRFDPDKKRKKGIAKSNELDFLGMDINHNIQHTPQLTALQMGATARIVYSHYVDDEDANAFTATMTATTALGGSAIDQMPTPRFTKDALNAASNPYDYERFKTNLVRRVGYVKGMNLLKMMGYGDGYNNEDKNKKDSRSSGKNSDSRGTAR